MDTIDLKIYTDREITEEDIQQLKLLKFINKVNLGKDGKIFQVSLPRYFYINNAYLITKQREIDTVLKKLVEYLKFLNYKVERLQLLRIDYPFTYYREEKESFYSYTQIWNIFNYCAELEGWESIPIGKNRNTYILQDTLLNGRSRKKIEIYNPASKVFKREGKKKLEINIEDYPDFEQRVRMETSWRNRREIKKSRDINLKEIKQNSYALIDKVIFRHLNEAKENAIQILTENIKKNRKEKGSTFKLGEFIRDNKEYIYDYTLLREAIKNAYSNKETARLTCQRARKILIELEKKDDIFYFENLKRIEKIKVALKKESLKSTLKK